MCVMVFLSEIYLLHMEISMNDEDNKLCSCPSKIGSG